MRDNVTYWTELSKYDIKTAEAMLETKRYLYVGFMAHQAIEKILKAYFVNIKNETAPFSHSLSFLAKQSDIFKNFSEEQIDYIDLLEPLNIEARYPTHKQQLLKSLTQERCAEILKNAQELQEWIMQKL
jgi:HEPN domain-containing protein